MHREVVEITRALEAFYWYKSFVGDKVVVVYDDDNIFASTVDLFFYDQPEHIQEKLRSLFEDAEQSSLSLEKSDIKIVNKTLAIMLMEMKQEVKEQLPDGWLM